MREDTIGIVTLLSKEHLMKGEYVVHVEVLLHKHAQTKAKRRVDKEGYVDDPCLSRSGISPPIPVIYDENKPFQIRFSISGCLKPVVELKEGQDILAFDPKKTECRRTLVLEPVSSGQTCAEIHFQGKVEQKFLHQVLISVPRDTITKKLSENDAKNFSATASTGSAGSMSSTTSSSTVGAASSITSSNFSMSSISSDSVPDETLRTRVNEQDTPATLEESPCDKLLSDANLQGLAKDLSPGDAAQLVVFLGLPSTAHSQSEKDHQGDSVRATATSLKKWHHSVEGTNAKKLNDLLSSLEQIGRNDLKAKWQKMYSEALG